jgi:putative membrane protein
MLCSGDMSGDVARGTVVGLIGGLLAAGLMTLGHRILETLSRETQRPASQRDDPTIKVASGAASVTGYRLSEAQKPRAGTIVHYAFGGGIGALYGAVAEVVPAITRVFGAGFGVAVWLGAHVIAVPALGLADPPTRQPLGKEAEELGLHLVYGSTTELVRRMLRGVHRSWSFAIDRLC